MESRHPWRTDITIKGSDRDHILISDSILMYATLIMWMNLSPYPNLCKAEKIKSTLRVLQEDFYSDYLTDQWLQIAEKVRTLRSLIDRGVEYLWEGWK